VHRALENNGGHKAAGAGGMRLVPAAGVKPSLVVW
jgi:hypothetical protein